MKTLSCERTNDLLPLYAAGDLEGERSREVAAHVGACDECRARTAWFEESRALLSEACEPPEFGEEFYAAMRGAVLSEIARAPVAPSKPSLVAALFPARRLVFASTFALLLLASLVALRHFSRDARATQQRPEAPTQIAKDTTQGSESAPKKIDEKTTTGSANARPARSHSQTAASPKSRPVAVVGDGSPSRTSLAGFERALAGSISVEPDRRGADAAGSITKESVGAEVAIAPRESVDPVRAAASSAGAAADPANAEPKVSRIEIQTADPNIRIIWLTPRKADEPAPDSDNHENGDRN